MVSLKLQKFNCNKLSTYCKLRTWSTHVAWHDPIGQAMYEQTVKVLIAFDKQHFTFAMLLTSWSFSRAKPNGKKHKLSRTGWPAAAPSSRPSESKGRNDNLGET